jgi:hypothetical protein
MPSHSYHRWRTVRAIALNEIEQAHAALGGTGRGRRFATQQVNHAYAVLLASQFQGFCRDLHTECVEHVIASLAPPAALQGFVIGEFMRARQLDQRNAQPASIGADFGRFGLNFWSEVESFDSANTVRKTTLELLNAWRNAIAHQDFNSAKLGGITTLRLVQVRRWRIACRHLARTFDEVMVQHLYTMTGAMPW